MKPIPEKGMTLVEVLVALGLISILALAITQITKIQVDNYVEYQSRLKVDLLGSQLLDGLFHRDTCGNMLKNIIGQSSYLYPEGSTHNIDIYDMTGTKVIIKPNIKVDGAYEVTSSKIIFDYFQPTVPPPPPNPSYIIAELKITADRLNQKSGTSEVKLSTKVLFKNISGYYSECLSYQDDDAACRSMGGVWDVTATPNCKLEGKSICSAIGGTWDSSANSCVY